MWSRHLKLGKAEFLHASEFPTQEVTVNRTVSPRSLYWIPTRLLTVFGDRAFQRLNLRLNEATEGLVLQDWGRYRKSKRPPSPLYTHKGHGKRTDVRKRASRNLARAWPPPWPWASGLQTVRKRNICCSSSTHPPPSTPSSAVCCQGGLNWQDRGQARELWEGMLQTIVFHKNTRMFHLFYEKLFFLIF